MYDYTASLARLTRRLADMTMAEWSPTPRVNELRKIAEDLNGLADRLVWDLGLEEAWERPDPTEIGIDGWPVEVQAGKFGRYQHLLKEMRDLAATANREADSLPNSRARIWQPWVADIYLHIRHQCGMNRPSAYIDGPGVIDLAETINAVLPEGRKLDRGTVKNLLSAALRTFNPLSFPDELFEILVFGQ